MVRRTFHELKPFVDAAVRQRGLALALSAGIASILEAAALLLTVRVAVALGTAEVETLTIPLVDASVSAGWLLGLAAVCGTLVVALHVANAHLTADISSRVLDRARRVAIASYVDADWNTQAQQREGALQETVTTLSIRTSVLVESLVAGCIQLFSLAVFIGASMAVDVRATAVVLVLGIAIVSFMRPLARSTRRRARAYVEANSAFAEDVTRLTSTSMELRVFGVQEAAENELARSSGAVRRRQLIARRSLLLGGGLYKDLAVLVLIICIGGLLVADTGQLTSMAVVVALMVRALASAQTVNHAYQTVNEGSVSVIALNERIGVLAAGRATTGTREGLDLAAIEFDGVGYVYNDEVPALSDISLAISAGEAFGIVGPSGGGKSTFVQVLLRLRPPTTGRVLVDGVDYLEFSDAAWARHIAFVPQEPTLLEGTIADNIRYYRDLQLDDIVAAAAAANVLEEIERLPAGFETKLGPRGIGVSGGQKQRIAIARALVGGPQLLVLDEPSSALDVHSEQLLKQTLEELKGKTTVVIVAHRLTTVESCDRLLVLQGGRIAQLGPPAELKSDEFYRHVVDVVRPDGIISTRTAG